jgi:hypothetical protein
VLAWYRTKWRAAIGTGVAGFALTGFLLTWRTGFQLHWMRYWEIWAGLLVIGLLVGLTQRKGSECSAGVEWVRGRKGWVRTYELVKVKSSASASGSVSVSMEDADGRVLNTNLGTLQQDALLWDLVYNGILHSVILGDAETNGALHQFVKVPYRSPYGS